MEVYGVVKRPSEITREARRRLNALWFHTPNTLHDLVHDDTGQKYGTVLVESVDSDTQTITARSKDGVILFRCSSTGHWKAVTDDVKGGLDVKLKEYSLRPVDRTLVHPRTPLQSFNAAAFSDPATLDLRPLDAVPTDLTAATVDAHNRLLGYKEVEENWEAHLTQEAVSSMHPEGPEGYRRSMKPAIQPFKLSSDVDAWMGDEVVRRQRQPQGAAGRYRS